VVVCFKQLIYPEEIIEKATITGSEDSENSYQHKRNLR